MSRKKIRVGILGATGMVGQNYLRLLANHPWFEVTYLAASERSAGKRYAEAVAGRWQMETPVPGPFGDMPVHDARAIPRPGSDCDMLFSAIALDKAATRALEDSYAASGFPMVSNNSAHRTTDDVPMLIPEINPGHLEIIPAQQKARGWDTGFIVTKPNCGIQSYMLPLAALLSAGFVVNRMITTNLQALSGAGYPGVAALDVTDNLAHLPSEEEKALVEPAKILGRIDAGKIAPLAPLAVSSHCVRVPVVHGHSSCVSFAVENGNPDTAGIIQAMRDYSPVPQQLELPTAPKPVIRVFEDPGRPQPRKDRDEGSGMTVSVGRVTTCPVLGYRFFCLSHNTVRGAAGGAILTAELLAVRGYLGWERSA